MAQTLLNTVEQDNLMPYVEYDAHSELYNEAVDLTGPKELVNCEWRYADFTNLSPGATNIISINNTANFVRNMYLNMTFEIKGDAVISQRWCAYHMLDKIIWRIGDNTDHQNSGWTNLFATIEQCRSEEDMNTLTVLSAITADAIKTSQLDEIGQEFQITCNALAPLTETTVISKAIIPLCLVPGTKIGKEKNKPIPLHLLKNPLEIEFRFANSFKAFFSGTQVTHVILKTCRLYYETLVTFPNFKKTPDERYIFKYFDWYDLVQGVTTVGANQKCSIVLHGIKPGECTQIFIQLAKLGSVYGEDISNINLRYQGVDIYNNPDNQGLIMQNLFKKMPVITEFSSKLRLTRIPIALNPNNTGNSYSTGANFKSGDLVLSFDGPATPGSYELRLAATVHSFLAFQNYVVQGTH